MTRLKDQSALCITLCDATFDPYALIKQTQPIMPITGAQSIFIGYMRDYREDGAVTAMEIHHYPTMTENVLRTMGEAAINDFSLNQLVIAHRVGHVTPTEALVVISACAGHRANATQATQHLLELLKHQAPFWKKETAQGTTQWVKENTKNELQQPIHRVNSLDD